MRPRMNREMSYNTNCQGWQLIHYGLDEEPVELALARLRHPCTYRIGPVERLVPRRRFAARPNSLSRKHGLNKQPPHTDGAHLTHPPSHILLWCPSPKAEQARTHLRTFYQDQIDQGVLNELRRSFWVVRINAQQFFYRRPFDERSGYLRWDSSCFIRNVTGSLTRTDIDAVFAGLPQTEWKWEAGKALLVDNRRVLHGRCAAMRPEDISRELRRVMIYEQTA